MAHRNTRRTRGSEKDRAVSPDAAWQEEKNGSDSPFICKQMYCYLI